MVELHQQCLDEQKLFMLPEELPGNRKYGWTKQQPFSVVYNNQQWVQWCETKLTRSRVNPFYAFRDPSYLTLETVMAIPRYEKTIPSMASR